MIECQDFAKQNQVNTKGEDGNFAKQNLATNNLKHLTLAK